MSEWISIKNKMPELDDECLIRIPVCGRFNIENGKYAGAGLWHGAWCDTRGRGMAYRVSHWMPRPAEPTE
jgi:hypothetical protein